MASQFFHISINIAGALNSDPVEFAQTWQGVFSRDDGTPMPLTEVREAMENELKLGRRLIKSQGCDNFDYQTGCKGHIQEEK